MILEIRTKRIPKHQSPNRITIPIRSMGIQFTTSIRPIHINLSEIPHTRHLYIIHRPHKMYPLQRPIGYQPRPSARFCAIRYDVPFSVSDRRIARGSPETEIVRVVHVHRLTEGCLGGCGTAGVCARLTGFGSGGKLVVPSEVSINPGSLGEEREEDDVHVPCIPNLIYLDPGTSPDLNLIPIREISTRQIEAFALVRPL